MKKPTYKRKNWRLGKSFGTWYIPICGNCKRQLGLIAKDNKIPKCPMCGQAIDWSEDE